MTPQAANEEEVLPMAGNDDGVSTETRRTPNHRARPRFGVIAVAALSLGGLFTVASPAAAVDQNPAIVVNNIGDGADANGADGVCSTGAGVCTLRAAIEQANYNIGPDIIEFDIAGSGPHRIVPSSTLPIINDSNGPVVIDGYSQPGALANTAELASNATIKIEIDGTNLTVTPAIIIESPGNTVRGLAIYAAKVGLELRNEAADGNKIVGNFIGTNAAATYENTSVSDGVLVNLGPDRNMIGTPALADRNVISGTFGRGVRINHGESSENRIQNNIIGLSPDGTRNLDQDIGVDLQYWTWGNLVGGDGVREKNVISGNQIHGGIGVDLSHMSTSNLILGNLIGTNLDGTSAPAHTQNRRGVGIKDNPEGNYIARNIFSGQTEYGIWHKHNYTGGNDIVDNRFGVGANGEDLGTDGATMLLRGHNDVYHGNIIGNYENNWAVVISNTSERTGHENFPDEQTKDNLLQNQTYYLLDRAPIEFGSTCCPHPDRAEPTITGIGPGEVYGSVSCAGCKVEVYASGTVAADGTLTPGSGVIGLTSIGWVTADAAGQFSMASPLINQGVRISAVSNSGGETSGFATVVAVPPVGNGILGNPSQPEAGPDAPVAPPLPQPYVAFVFECTVEGATLSWTDAGADTYYIFATTDDTETYLGGHTGTNLTVTQADSYRVEHWLSGRATNAICSQA